MELSVSGFGVTEMSQVINFGSVVAVAQQLYSISRVDIAPALARKSKLQLQVA